MAGSRHQKDLAQPTVVPWTEDLALRAARVDTSKPRAEQLKELRVAIRAQKLSPAAIKALRDAGWRGLRR